jgi:hypothetical protein
MTDSDDPPQLPFLQRTSSKVRAGFAAELLLLATTKFFSPQASLGMCEMGAGGLIAESEWVGATGVSLLELSIIESVSQHVSC